MSNEFKYDDSNLQRLFAEMEPKKRLKALKSAFRREANYVRKVAISNLRASVKSNKDLEKGVRAVVFKKVAGFRVTVAPSARRNKRKGIIKTYGYHKNRFGREKPVAMWLEMGAPIRKTKGGKYATRQKPHSTGSLKSYGYLDKTKQITEDQTTGRLHDELVNSITKEAHKYGCR